MTRRPPSGGLSPPPSRRAVLLGASNLTRGFAAALGAAQAVLGGPIEVLAALGHGRSYGTSSRVLGRGIPGIVECGLWEALESRPPLPTTALLTDIGNDVVYGASSEAIAGWVEGCLERLAAAGARTALTLLPRESIGALSPWGFAAVRRIIFPGRPISFAAVLDRARELDGRLRDLADRLGAAIVAPRREWYGIDPIHIRLTCWPEAWLEMLRPWRIDVGVPSPVPFSFRAWLALRGLRPKRWTLFGIERRRRQPCRVLPDGTTISLF